MMKKLFHGGKLFAAAVTWRMVAAFIAGYMLDNERTKWHRSGRR